MLQLLADVPSYEQGDEGTYGGAVEAGDDQAQALVDRLRIESVVELLMDEVRNIM